MENRLTKEEMQRKIVYLNAIMAVLVIWIHTYNIEIYGIRPDSLFNGVVYHFEEYLHRFEEFCVPFFFMLSAYLFFVNYELTIETIKRKYVSRFKSLFIPYLIWNLVGFIYFAFMTHFPPIASRMNMEPVKLSPLTYLYSLWNVDYNGSLWYLRNLIIFVMLSPLIYLLVKNRGRLYIGVITLFLVALYIFLPTTPYLFDRYDRCIYYLIGAYIAVNHKDIIYRKNEKLGFGLLAACMLLNCYVTANEPLNFMRITLTIFAVWLLPMDRLMAKEPKWFLQISFFGYCIHTFILEVFEKLWLLVWGYSALAAILDYIIAPIVTMGLIVLIAGFVKKIMPKTWKVITGTRG